MPTISVQAAVSSSVGPIPSDTLFQMAHKPVVQAFDSALKPCPARCSDAGNNPSNWTVYHDAGRLAWCNETMLLDFAIYNPLEDPETQISIRSCSADANTNANGTPNRLRSDVSCVPAKNEVEVKASLQMTWTNSPNQGNAVEVVAAALQMLSYLAQTDAGCDSTTVFASSGHATMGLYSGSQIQAQGISKVVLQQFIDQVQSQGIFDSLLVQLCGSDDRGADFALGIVANTNASLAFVQSAVKTWSDGKCVHAYDGAAIWKNTTFWAPNSSKHNNSTNNSTSVALQAARVLQVRGTCTTVQVGSGDSCGTLASKCGITGAAFTQYNPGSTMCSTLQPGQHVCCSAGTLPNFSPKPNSDGSCASYLVVAGDYCQKIASANSLTVTQLANFNNNTWGWTGCNNLQAGVKMCLSTGSPPMPAPIPNAVCGPQVAGTQPPTVAGVTLASLNPCPLNACCDIWGQCGTTDEFCTISLSLTGAPGTAFPGTNGCISNCGSGLIIGTPPAAFKTIAYFEAFNYERPCLNMDVTEIDTTKYTHIHLAFATITAEFNVDISGIQDQFSRFVSMTGVKRILSFGGWSFSTDQDTYPIFRNGVTPANRNTFIANLVNFVKAHNIDGLDFDWEYPGATDIPGIPPGSPTDGANYFVFLYYLKQALPSGITVSIAAPASFWYLKGFPIDAMGVILDYIVYMTYDLHGQWDYGNQWSDSGCPGGNCLRSHINLTETVNALSMITKAGVPSAKVVVGVTSYGRAFEMTKPGCVDEWCTYTGPASGATPGKCTGTAGYIANAEIDAIISGGGVLTYNDNSFSNILVYNSTQWVAYMDDNNKAERTNLYQSYHFGGTSDWAVDLVADGDVNPGDDDANSTAPCDYSLSFATLADLENVSGQYSTYCVELYAVQTLSNELVGALANFTDVNNGYDALFGYYVDYINDMIPQALQTFMASDNGPGNKYFECTYATGGVNHTTRTCPFDRFSLGEGTYTVYFDLKNSTGFYNDLSNNYGIDPSWIIFGEKDIIERCTPIQSKSGCDPVNGKWLGFPTKASSITVPNPKDIITAAGPNMSTLQNKIDATWMDQMMGQWDGSGLDAVQVLAMPVAMVQQAVSSMAQVNSIGQTEEDEKKKELILTILTAVFAIVPFVGDIGAAAAGLTSLARMIALIGEVANDALSMYSIVEDPTSAPMAVFGMLLGASALGRNPDGFATMGGLRRGMGADDIAKMGNVFADQTKVIQKIVKSCSA